MRKKLIALAALLFSLTLATPVFAAELAVTSIGSLDTSTGTFYDAWWYTTENPTLAGTAAASSTVTITIDTIDYIAAADTLGNWSYQPTTLTTGDHTVSITDGVGTVVFSLAIGSDTATTTDTIPLQTSTDSASSKGGTLPDSGVGSLTVFLALGGLAALGFGTYTFVFAKEK